MSHRSRTRALATRLEGATDAQQRNADDCPADHGAGDAPWRGPRENGDDGQDDQIQATKKVELLRSHSRVIARASHLLNAKYKRETSLIPVPSLCWD